MYIALAKNMDMVDLSTSVTFGPSFFPPCGLLESDLILVMKLGGRLGKERCRRKDDFIPACRYLANVSLGALATTIRTHLAFETFLSAGS
jgi:hypothetical protein